MLLDSHIMTHDININYQGRKSHKPINYIGYNQIIDPSLYVDILFKKY